MRKHIDQLDALRAFAVGLVLLTHFWQYPETTVLLNRVASFGWVGVDLFFVLSGFLITGILQESRTKPGYFKNFYMRRALRIFPLYYALLLIVFVALPIVSTLPESLTADGSLYFLYLSNIALLWGWQLFLVDITWSLAIEEQFYLVWPAVVKWLSNQRLMTVCLAIIVLAPLARLIIWPMGWRWTHMLTPLRMDDFAIGALLAIWINHPAITRWAPKVFWAGSAMVLALVLAGQFAMESMLVNTIGYTITGLVSAALIAVSLNVQWLKNPALLHVGKVSYGVYLLHPLCLLATSTVVDQAGLALSTGLPALDSGLRVIAMTAITIGVATLSFRIFEMPFLQMKRHFTPGSAVNQTPHMAGEIQGDKS